MISQLNESVIILEIETIRNPKFVSLVNKNSKILKRELDFKQFQTTKCSFGMCLTSTIIPCSPPSPSARFCCVTRSAASLLGWECQEKPNFAVLRDDLGHCLKL